MTAHREAARPDGARSYVIYAPTPWEGSWQPAHNLARALATNHRVLYVDPPLSPLTPIRYGVRGEASSRMRAVARRRVHRSGPLHVFSPLTLPPVSHPGAVALSAPVVRSQVRRAVASVRLAQPVIVLAWRSLPAMAGAADEALPVSVVMDHPAAGAELLGRDPHELEAEAKALCRSAGLVLTTSRSVQALLAECGFANELVPFGFPGDLANAYDSASVPPEYAKLPRPLLGYTGGIDDRLDYDLILALADRFKGGSLVFVGAVSPRLSPVSRRALGSRSNIHVLGVRPRVQLPGYVRHLDVALLPYRDSLFTRYQSPMKFWEYLYAGPPIVAVGTPELRRHPQPLINYAESTNEAMTLAEQALAHPLAGAAERRRVALSNTWHDRAVQIDALVSERLEGRSHTVRAGLSDGDCTSAPTTRR
jgi:hypothetical protein